MEGRNYAELLEIGALPRGRCPLSATPFPSFPCFYLKRPVIKLFNKTLRCTAEDSERLEPKTTNSIRCMVVALELLVVFFFLGWCGYYPVVVVRKQRFEG